MAHADSETPRDYSSSSDMNMGVLWTIAVIGTLIVVITVLFSQAAFQLALEKEWDRKVAEEPNPVQAFKDEQQAALDVHLEAAMAQTIESLQQETPQAPEGVDEHRSHDH